MRRLTFDDVAAAYDGFMGQWTRLYVPALLRAAHVAHGQQVLDMATGTGESALMAADVVGARGTIVGVDVSLPMLRGAQGAASRRPLRGTRLGSVEQMPWFGGLAEELLAQFPARRDDLFRERDRLRNA